MFDPHTLTILSLGFVLGLRHALDADHLAALSTVLAERPTVQASTSIGFFWGLGHTLMLLCVGTPPGIVVSQLGSAELRKFNNFSIVRLYKRQNNIGEQFVSRTKVRMPGLGRYRDYIIRKEKLRSADALEFGYSCVNQRLADSISSKYLSG